MGAVETVEDGGVSGDSGGRGDSGSSEGQWRKEGLGLVIVWLLTIIRRSYKSLLKKKRVQYQRLWCYLSRKCMCSWSTRSFSISAQIARTARLLPFGERLTA